MLHKIRHAMTEADASIKLCGFVQVNDVWFGHTRHSSWKRHPREYPLLIGATMKEPDTPVYLKIKLVWSEYIKDRSIIRYVKDKFSREYVSSDANHADYVIGRGISSKYKKLYSYFKQIDRWIRSTFHGVGSRYLQVYLNEFCYRLNLKLQNKNIFQQLTDLCVNSQAICYETLVLSKMME